MPCGKKRSKQHSSGWSEIHSNSTGNITQFSYDALSRATKIEERTAGSVTSTKQHLWCEQTRCEERDASGSLSNGKQFFEHGQSNYIAGISTNHFYTSDHLRSTREMTKTLSGTTTIVAQYGYSAFGQTTKLLGADSADFQFAAYYSHPNTNLNLTRTRQYYSNLGIWISRDAVTGNPSKPHSRAPLATSYQYCSNSPVIYRDPLGLFCKPFSTPGDPEFPDCGKDDHGCCDTNTEKCKSACAYWVGPEGLAPDEKQYQECISCCHGKGEACKRSNEPKFPGSHWKNCIDALWERGEPGSGQ